MVSPGVLVLPEGVVECGLLGGGEGECEGCAAAEDAVVVVVFGSEGVEVAVVGLSEGAVEYVEPYGAGGEAVEDEAAEESVFGVGDEAVDLSRGAGEQGGEARGADVDVLAVFAADVGYGLVVECFAESVGVVAVV